MLLWSRRIVGRCPSAFPFTWPIYVCAYFTINRHAQLYCLQWFLLRYTVSSSSWWSQGPVRTPESCPQPPLSTCTCETHAGVLLRLISDHITCIPVFKIKKFSPKTFFTLDNYTHEIVMSCLPSAMVTKTDLSTLYSLLILASLTLGKLVGPTAPEF